MVTVKLFGTLRLNSGVKEFTAEADSVRALYPLVLAEIRKQKPDSGITEKALKSCLIAVNDRREREAGHAAGKAPGRRYGISLPGGGRRMICTADKCHKIKKAQGCTAKMPYSPETVKETHRNRKDQIP